MGISVVCILAGLVYTFMPPLAQQAFVELAGALPSDTAAMFREPIGDWHRLGLVPVFTSLFVHSSWLHMAGNLVYLWVFGLAVERRAGSLRFALLFLLGGALAHVVVALRIPQLETPVIGASGAVSAVVGAYLVLFPSRRIGLYLPLGLYLQFARVPALLVIGSWFTLQLVYTAFGPITGAEAWWTHLAGFAMGIVLALLARALALFRF
ncbi:MAG: rhomboid family intramembrane serine protease [Xanthomonadales bacterium]|nr:rhomboid family intramembrane serine protease [Xanthomonadales bacterium]NIX11847.1 rhomboid family intramembrane serine protease [Xanthomonadales bacterium]